MSANNLQDAIAVLTAIYEADPETFETIVAHVDEVALPSARLTGLRPLT